MRKKYWFFILISFFVITIPVFAKYAVTNEKYLFGLGAKTNTIGGETFTTDWRMMIDKRQQSGDVSVRSVISEKINLLKTEVTGITYNFQYGSNDGRYSRRIIGRPGKPTSLHWEKNDDKPTGVYIVGAYQY